MGTVLREDRRNQGGREKTGRSREKHEVGNRSGAGRSVDSPGTGEPIQPTFREKNHGKKGGAINIHRFLARTDEVIYKAEIIISVFLTVVLIVVVFLQVIFRYIINNPLGWSEEFSRYVFVWTCMLGASIGIKKKAHYGLEAIFQLIPESKRKYVEIFLYILIGSFLMVLVYYGFNLSRDIYQQTTPGLEISMSIPYSSIPVGALLMLVHVLLMPFNDQNKNGNRSC